MNDQHEILRLAGEDLACYGIAMWRGLELAAHQELIVDALERVERGVITRLMISIPPRHGKSLWASLLFPSWYLGRNPHKAIMASSYGQELSDDFGRQVRNLVSDPLHSLIFPDFHLARDSTSMRHFSTSAGGGYYAVGRGGAMTGRGADLLLLDDLIKDSCEAGSEQIRQMIYQWYTSVALTRLQPDGGIVLISTRWHEDDLSGRLLRESGDGLWHVLSLPAIAERDESFRVAGGALRPEKFPLSILDQRRKEVGSAVWASLYQQRPSAAEGTTFKRAWFAYYRQHPPFKRIVQSWDTAYKTGSEHDFSACTTWGMTQNAFYLLSYWRGRVEFPELKKRMTWLASEYAPTQILVEDRASGQSVIQELKAETILPIVAVKVDRDKISRAQAVTALFEAGRVFLPESAPWLPEYVDEMAAFPTGVHDDAVDSTTQALNYLRHQPQHMVSITNAFTGEYLGGSL